jgi:uncharacterized protein YgiB involved in biofilm formation
MDEFGHHLSRRARRRKRTQRIWLTLAGLGAGSVFLYELIAPGSRAVATDFYGTREQCSAAGKYSASDCARFFDDAAAEQRQSAPRYASRADCEAEFSNGCAALPAELGASANLFVPAVAGLLVGGALAAGATAPRPLPVYDDCSRREGPDCSRNSGSGGTYTGGGRVYHTASGYRVETASTSATVDSRALSTPAPSATLARGGFGARAAAIRVAS